MNSIPLSNLHFHIVCLYPLVVSFFSTLIFIPPNFPREAYFSFSHPTFFSLHLISCFLYCEPMAHAQPEPIDGSFLHLQDNHISDQVWEGQERMIHSKCNSVWIFTHLDVIDNRVKT